MHGLVTCLSYIIVYVILQQALLACQGFSEDLKSGESREGGIGLFRWSIHRRNLTQRQNSTTLRPKWVFFSEAAFATGMSIIFTHKGMFASGGFLMTIGAFLASKALYMVPGNTFEMVCFQLAALYVALGLIGRFFKSLGDISSGFELIGVNFFLLALIEMYLDVLAGTIVLCLYNTIGMIQLDAKHCPREFSRCILVATLRLWVFWF